MRQQLVRRIAQFAKDIDQVNKSFVLCSIWPLNCRDISGIATLELRNSFRLHGAQESEPAWRIVCARFPGMDDTGEPAGVRIPCGVQPAVPAQQSRVDFMDKILHRESRVHSPDYSR